MPNGEQRGKLFQHLSLVSNQRSRVANSLRGEILTLGDPCQGCCSRRDEEMVYSFFAARLSECPRQPLSCSPPSPLRHLLELFPTPSFGHRKFLMVWLRLISITSLSSVLVSFESSLGWLVIYEVY